MTAALLVFGAALVLLVLLLTLVRMLPVDTDEDEHQAVLNPNTEF